MDSGKVLLGALAGFAAGAALGVLFAPDSGGATREKIARAGNGYGTKLRDKFNRVSDEARQGLETAKDELAGMTGKGSEKQGNQKDGTQAGNKQQAQGQEKPAQANPQHGNIPASQIAGQPQQQTKPYNA